MKYGACCSDTRRSCWNAPESERRSFEGPTRKFTLLRAIGPGKLTANQVQELLGFETGMEVDAFLKAHGVPLEMTLEDLEEGRKSLDALLGK